MGSQPWLYAVPYPTSVAGRRTVEKKDLEVALDALKEREFRAGRYYPAIEDKRTSYVHPEKIEGPGARHATIAEALEASDADGTQTVLDMMAIGTTPAPHTVVPLTDAALESLFGTARPTRADLQRAAYDWVGEVGRGEGVALVLFTGDGVPHEILFAGYSFD